MESAKLVVSPIPILIPFTSISGNVSEELQADGIPLGLTVYPYAVVTRGTECKAKTPIITNTNASNPRWVGSGGRVTGDISFCQYD